MVHGCMVDTERAEMAAVSRSTSHVTVKQRCNYTTSVNIKKTRHKNLVTHVKLHASAVSSRGAENSGI